MIPRLRPAVSLSDVIAAARGRETVASFEAAFAELAQQRHAIAFPYGRTGLLLLLEALGLKGREIICPAYTCVVVAHAIVLSGNVPIFVDSEDGGFNMDLVRAEAQITERTGAIIATSIHGYPVDLDRLGVIRARHRHVRVIQDCAHSFLAEHGGHPVHKAGEAALFALNVSKLMTSIFGGMVTTDDDDVHARLTALRDGRLRPAGPMRHAERTIYLAAAAAALSPAGFTVTDQLRRMGLLGRFTDYYDPNVIDMPADHLVQMTRAEASVGVRQTARYRAIVEHRRAVASVYHQALDERADLVLPPLITGATYSHYVPQVADPERMCRAMAAKGVELGRIIDYCVPDMPAYAGYRRTGADFPVTRRLNRRVINLPLHVGADSARTIARKLADCLDRDR